MPFSLHVDTPVLPVTALGSMHAAVNRISDGGVLFGGDQRITPRQALEAYTTYASLCCGGNTSGGASSRAALPILYCSTVILKPSIRPASGTSRS